MNLTQIIEKALKEWDEEFGLHCEVSADQFITEKIKEVWFESRKATIQEYDLDK